MIEIVTSFFIIVGALFMMFGSLGLLRMPDVFNRIHAVTKSSSMGVLCVLAASVIYFSSQMPTFSLKQLGAMGFLFISNPVASVMIARAAYLGGAPMAPTTVRDDLRKLHRTVEHHE